MLDSLIMRLDERIKAERAPLDQFHQKLAGHMAAKEFDAADHVLNQCGLDNGECGICSRIVCPHSDPFHFHHDGCPACSQDDMPADQGGAA